MDVSNPSEVFERTNGIFNAQYDKLKSISSYIGELWFAKRKNYVPHFYAMDESLKKQTNRKKEVAKQENGRKYDTYLADIRNELIPETKTCRVNRKVCYRSSSGLKQTRRKCGQYQMLI